MSRRRRSITCFAGDDWDGNPHSRHHLMRRFAERWDVLFVEGVPMRSLSGVRTDEARRVLRKLRSRHGLRTVAPGLHVLRPVPVPPAGPVGRRVQLEVLRAQVLMARRRLGLAGPSLSWFSLPVAAPLLGRFGESGSLFYYQDRYDAFSAVDDAYLRSCIRSLAEGCDLTIASAEGLADDLRRLGAEPVVVRHGVDSARFSGEHRPPADLAGRERPLVGYVGIVDDYLDFGLLRAVADRLERGTLVIVGAHNTDVSALTHPRIALLGRRPFEDIPAYLAAFDCCLVPFQVNRLTEAVNPIKVREYLAAGRPVVSTLLPEVEAYADVVTVARSPQEFLDAVTASLRTGADTDEQRALRRSRVAAESWDGAAAAIERLMDTVVPPPR